jgi:hypothetical protein
MMTDEKKEFRVRIMYREPTFEARNGLIEEPFDWTYSINAVDKAAAIALAIKEFHATARLSSFGWVRKMVSVEVTDAEESPI